MAEFGDGAAIQGTMESIVDNLFTRLRLIAVDVEKVQRAKEFLSSMQRRSTFLRLLGPAEDESVNRDSDLALLHTKYSMNSNLFGITDVNALEEDFGGEEMSEDLCQMSFEEDRWHSFFQGFEILNSPIPCDPNENRKCVELSVLTPCDREIKSYLSESVLTGSKGIS